MRVVNEGCLNLSYFRSFQKRKNIKKYVHIITIIIIINTMITISYTSPRVLNKFLQEIVKGQAVGGKQHMCILRYKYLITKTTKGAITLLLFEEC